MAGSRRSIALVVLAVLVLRWARGAESARPPQPSRTRINPFALELRLLVQMAREKPEVEKDLATRAEFLTRFGGTGYAISAVYPNASAAAGQQRMRAAAYMALTAPPLNEASSLVDSLYKREKIRLKPESRPDKDKGRAAPITALIRATIREIEWREDRLRQLEKETRELERVPRRQRPDPRSGPATEMARLRTLIAAFRDLQKTLQGLVPQILAYDAFAEDIEKLREKEEQQARAEVAATKTGQLAAGDPGIVSAVAVGTQQVRVIVTEEKRKEIEAALAERFIGSPPKGEKEIGMLSGDLSFLPTTWSLKEEVRPHGDFHTAEYISGDEVFLTLFDATGLWERVIAVEYANRISVLVPARPARM
ncbi:MAG: hypothetical protein JXP34_14345 [Planctomycetes bacterium]|nr:hypothetical protein [Planctomycetota bacterium]